jgi:lactose/L-arabinose transport system substrate-binding protein
MAEAATVPSRPLHSVIGWTLVLLLGAALVLSLKPRGRGPAPAATLDLTKLRRPDQLEGHLTAWGWNIAAKSLKGITPAFQQRYPNINVNVEMAGATAQPRFLLSLSARTGAPDVMQLQGYEAPRYIATGRLTDLTPVAAKYANDFPAASWANCVHEGRVYAIPWDIGPCAVFYKPAIFAKYNIDPSTIQTWDDFIAAGQHILKASGGRTKMLPLSPGELQYAYEMMLQQLGGQVFDEQGRIAVGRDESIRVMELIRRMLDAGICANVRAWGHDWMAGFGSDTIATYPGAVWLGGTIKDTVGAYGAGGSGWAVFPLPSFERGGRSASNMGGSVLVIPDQCTQKEAAWAFIEHALCTREGQVAQYANFDLFPAYLPALEDPFFAQPDPFYGGQHVRSLFAGRVRDVQVLNRTGDWVEAIGYATQSFSRWADEREETRPMLQTLAGKLGRRLGRPVAPAEAMR